MLAEELEELLVEVVDAEFEFPELPWLRAPPMASRTTTTTTQNHTRLNSGFLVLRGGSVAPAALAEPEIPLSSPFQCNEITSLYYTDFSGF